MLQRKQPGNAAMRSLAPAAIAGRKVALSTLSLLPPRHLRKIVTAALMAQGVGWGADTPEAEVRAITGLMASDRSTTVVDVGANVGAWTLAWLANCPTARVICVEPSSANVAILSDRFTDDARVQIVQAATGSRNGVASLAAPSTGSVRATLFPDTLEEMPLTETVRLLTIDQLRRDLNLSVVDVLKLDVEGAELDTLLGATDTLASTGIVQFEYGEPDLYSRVWFRDLWDLLTGAGFTIRRLTPRGPQMIDHYEPALEVPRCTNFVAVRRGTRQRDDKGITL